MSNDAPIVSIRNLGKTYASGFRALDDVSLDIRRGEIFALLGPNGAGKTTLINIVCGIVNASSGSVLVDGHDIVREARAARMQIGLVPQELSTDAFESVWATLRFSRGLFGRPPDPAHLEKVLRSLSLWDKRDSKIMALSGGMKRRVLIAKALSHEPRILFLDEPTAGVDVELRREMWQLVRELRESGVTIILTTHYIEEAEKLCKRVILLRRGTVVADGSPFELIGRAAGLSTLWIEVEGPFEAAPLEAAGAVAQGSEGRHLRFSVADPGAVIVALGDQLRAGGGKLVDLRMRRPTLEDVYLEWMGEGEGRADGEEKSA